MNDIDWDALQEQIKIEEPKPQVTKPGMVTIEYESEGISEEKARNNKYYMMKRLMLYYNAIRALEYKTDAVRDLFRAVQTSMREYIAEEKELMISDLKEIDKCFEVGAYKATLVMTGAVLENLLLSWLSERDGVDYFTNPFMVKKTIDGVQKDVEDDRLWTYINALPELKRPKWMKKNCNIIRNKRNLIHIKFQMKEDIEINKELCEEVIGYLKDVVNERFRQREEALND